MLSCRTVTMKDNASGKLTVIYNAEEVYSGLKTPIVNDLRVMIHISYTIIHVHVRVLDLDLSFSGYLGSTVNRICCSME